MRIPNLAPGAPGREPRWAPGQKSGVGAALATNSNVWFTLCRGVVSEVFYPSVDTACTRDFRFFVTGLDGFVADEERDMDSQVEWLEPGVPAFQVVNRCKKGRFRIEKTVLTDSHRAAFLTHTQFEALHGDGRDYRLIASLNPHLGNKGTDHNAWFADFKGTEMLFAERDGFAIALACSIPWLQRSVGFVGVSDVRRDLERNGRMTWSYDRAEGGNVSLNGEVDPSSAPKGFTLAVGVGRAVGEAAHCARAALLEGFEESKHTYVEAWSRWQKEAVSLGDKASGRHRDLLEISAAVMRTHEDNHLAGAMVASLAIPWGDTCGDDQMGYHLVWPRDLIETVGGQVAIRKHADARRVLFYMLVTQEKDGHWPQNMSLDGNAWWKGTQLDETAFVLLLVDLLRREEALTEQAIVRRWPMLRQAIAFLVQHGPVTPMDRWEEIPGYYASTLAVEVPALLVAAELAVIAGEPDLAAYLHETADAWNEAIEPLLYVTGTDLAQAVGVDGYYARFALPDQMQAAQPAAGMVQLANHTDGKGRHRVAEVVSPDALALVRFGLRAADDPRIVNTVKVIDHVLKTDLPGGPCWRRYTDDGYGEHEDGSAFDGTGIGRCWPLLTGERAHYELAAGQRSEAERLLEAMDSFANASGLLPEQVWDAADLPDKHLYRGQPTGSATPLVWAHAEYVKLRRSLKDGKVFDMPPQSAERYVKQRITATHVIWRPDQRWRSIPVRKTLRLEFEEPTQVRWRMNEASDWRHAETTATGLGMHKVDLPTADLAAGIRVILSLASTSANSTNETEHEVRIGDNGPVNGVAVSSRKVAGRAAN